MLKLKFQVEVPGLDGRVVCLSGSSSAFGGWEGATPQNPLKLKNKHGTDIWYTDFIKVPEAEFPLEYKYWTAWKGQEHYHDHKWEELETNRTLSWEEAIAHNGYLSADVHFGKLRPTQAASGIGQSNSLVPVAPPKSDPFSEMDALFAGTAKIFPSIKAWVIEEIDSKLTNKLNELMGAVDDALRIRTRSIEEEVSTIAQPIVEKMLYDQVQQHGSGQPEGYGKEKAQTSSDLNDLRGKVAKLEGCVELLLTKADKGYVDAAVQESGRKSKEAVVRLEAEFQQEKVRVCHEFESMRERVGLIWQQAQKWEAAEAQLRAVEAEVKRFCSPSPASTDVMERQPQRQESAPAAKECTQEPVAGPFSLSVETKVGPVATVIPKLSSLDETTRLDACSADPPRPMSMAAVLPATCDEPADANYLDSVCDVSAACQAPPTRERPVTPWLGTVPHAPARSPAGVAPASSMYPSIAATESPASVSPTAAGGAAARARSLSGGGLRRAEPAVSAGDRFDMFYHQDQQIQAIINDKIRKEIMDAQAKKVPYDEKKKILKGILLKIHPDKVAVEEKGKHHEAHVFLQGWEKKHKDWFLGTAPNTAPSAPLYSS